MSRFDYTTFTATAAQIGGRLIPLVKRIENALDELPEPREKNLAFTKLEETVMWARKALREV